MLLEPLIATDHLPAGRGTGLLVAAKALGTRAGMAGNFDYCAHIARSLAAV